MEQPLRILLVGENLPTLAGAIARSTSKLGISIRIREEADSDPARWEMESVFEGIIVIEVRSLVPNMGEQIRRILTAHTRSMLVLVAGIGTRLETLMPAVEAARCMICGRMDADELALTMTTAASYMTIWESETAGQDRIRALEQKVDILFQNSPNAIFLIDARTGRIRAFNQRAFEAFGYTRTELAKMPFRFLFPETASDSSDALLRRLSVRASDFEEQGFRRADGRVQVYDLSARFVTWEGQVAIIAELRETAGRIDTARERDLYRRVFEECAEAVAVLDSKGNFLFTNPAFTTLTGFTREETIGRPASVLIGEGIPTQIVEDIGRIVSGGIVWKGQLEGPNRAGERIHVDTVISPTHDRSGAISTIIVVATDRTEEANLRRSLAQSQRMEAIGHLAGGIAHDFNNILTVIQSAGAYLAEGIDKDSPLQEEIVEILSSSHRAGDLTRQLLTYSRRSRRDADTTDLNDVVSPLVRMLRRIIGDNIELRVDCCEGKLPVRLDATQIQQILFNLASNARDAMPDGGVLSVSTWQETLSPELARMLKTKAGQYALLQVSDSGVGIPSGMLLRIFDPYFTTKEEGKGTGIGLATVDAIVRQADGSVFAESKEGEGSIFTVRLPLQKADSRVAVSQILTNETATSGIVLLAEDEPAVRRLATRVLRQRGYEVVEASDGLEALDQAKEMAGAFDILVTDVTMPRMSGIRLAETLRAEKPELPVLFICGFSEDDAIREGLEQGHLGYLQKPFTPSELADRVGRLLAGELHSP